MDMRTIIQLKIRFSALKLGLKDVVITRWIQQVDGLMRHGRTSIRKEPETSRVIYDNKTVRLSVWAIVDPS